MTYTSVLCFLCVFRTFIYSLFLYVLLVFVLLNAAVGE